MKRIFRFLAGGMGLFILLACSTVSQWALDNLPQPGTGVVIATMTITPSEPTLTASPTTDLSIASACIPDNPREMGTVTTVVDGDTIHVELDDGIIYPVRYIGVDTPETSFQSEPFGQEAASFNAALVEGQIVTLIRDVSETDPYGRLLRYVIAGDTFVNYELIRLGYAEAVIYEPDRACYEFFLQVEASARKDRLGQWALLPEETGAPADGGAGKIQITFLFYHGTGQNEPDEYVEFENQSDQPVQLQGWSLEDEAGHRFQFPRFLLEPDQKCRVYTDEFHLEHCGFSFGRTSSAVWNNGGDCARLFDAEGVLVDEYCY